MQLNSGYARASAYQILHGSHLLREELIFVVIIKMSAETSTGYIPVPFVEDDDASGPPTPRNKQPDQYHPVVTAQPSSELMVL